MSISETVNRAALAWVRATVDPEATEVIGFTDRTVDRGYCSTCSYTQAVVDVNYKTSINDHWSRWGTTTTYEGNFAEFINALDEYDI